MNRYSLALLALLVVPNSALALTVTSSADSGAGTLRQAILDAAAGDTIDFAAGISPITLTSAELLINKSLTISGPGANLLTVRRSTAGGTANFRIFHIASGAFNVTISGLTISNGNIAANGGGISNESTSPVHIADSTVSGNTAAGAAGGGIENWRQLAAHFDEQHGERQHRRLRRRHLRQPLGHVDEQHGERQQHQLAPAAASSATAARSS